MAKYVIEYCDGCHGYMFGAVCNALNFREVSLRLHSPRFSRRSQMQMMQEIQRRIDGWEGKDICQTCSEFITGG